MTKKLQKDILFDLRDGFSESGYESVVHENDGITVLKVLVDMLGEEEDGAAILEIMFPDENASVDMELVQYYVTFDFEVNIEKSYEIYNALNQINLLSAIGAFVMLTKEKQMYFKYSGVVSADTCEKAKEFILPVVNWLIPMLEEAYDSMRTLAAGTF
jgi:hypothetical protein